MPPDGVQLGAGVVADLVLGQDRVEHVLLERTVGEQAARHRGDVGRVFPLGDQAVPGASGGAQRFGHVEQRLGAERRAHPGALEVRAHVGHEGHGVRAGIGHDDAGLLGLGLPLPDRALVRGGRERRDALFAQVGQRQRAEHLADFREFQYSQGSFLHTYHLPA